MSIKVENVSKFYNSQKVLSEISFEICKGEIVGFLGPNGAGKSTMMKILTGFIPQTQGKVRILQISNKVTLIENLSLMENCYYFTHEDSISKESIIAKAEVFHQSLQKDFGILNPKIVLAELALAQIINPEILCIDEPVNYLDNEGIEILKKLLKKRM